METERLRLNVEVEVVAKALPGLRAKCVAISLRRTHQTELHGVNLTR